MDIIQNSVSGQEGLTNQVPLTDEKYEPISDGNIPQNSQGITRGVYDSLNAVGSEQLEFEKGNFPMVLGLPNMVNDKVESFSKTFIPLVEVALIELLGSNQLYTRDTCQCDVKFENGISITFSLIYSVSNWVGTDIEIEAIQHDSEYVFNRIKPLGVNLSKCEINTEEGTLTVMGVI